MKKDDIKYIVIFCLLILLILAILIYNINRNNNIRKRNIKSNNIINNMTYNGLYNKSVELFLNSIIIAKKDFYYEKEDNGSYKNYAMIDKKDYKKIINGYLINEVLNEEDKNNYLKENDIILFENNYYIRKINILDSNYIGSEININNYNDNYIYLDLINYYCNDYNYVGLIIDKPTCNYDKKETNLVINISKNGLKIKNINDVYEIIA